MYRFPDILEKKSRPQTFNPVSYTHLPAGYVLHHPDLALPLSPDEEETPQYVGSDLPYSHCIPSHWKKAWYTPATEVDVYKRQEYKDKGYSGKNTVRPQLQQLLTDIRRGEVEKAVSYTHLKISMFPMEHTLFTMLQFQQVILLLEMYRQILEVLELTQLQFRQKLIAQTLLEQQLQQHSV